jgi:hypothetical protein
LDCLAVERLNDLFAQPTKPAPDMNAKNNIGVSKAVSPRFVKTNIPNLIKLEPMDTYYGRCKVYGKTIRQSLETKDFKVAKSKFHKWLIDVRGRVHANEGDIGGLIEEYKRGLRLQVASRDTHPAQGRDAPVCGGGER